MSGVETVIGLVLGVLPLLVSTAEHYDDVFRPFRRYKMFSKELMQFQQEFLGHKTIFHNECLLFLSNFTGVETANEMLRKRDHPLRKDLDLSKKLADQLGASQGACRATIGLIAEELDGIHRESQSFKVATCEDISGRLDRRLDRLKNYNRLFGRLSAQTKELKNCQEVAELSPSLPRSDQRRQNERTRVQDAAIHLYNALVDACTTHPEHLAHFRLDPQHQAESSPPSIRFDVAFAQNLLEGRSHDADPIWFAIESMFSENLMKEPDIQPEEANEARFGFKPTLKRAAQQFSPLLIPAKKPKRNKTVMFVSPHVNNDSRSFVPPPQLPSQNLKENCPDLLLPNFCIDRDFCNHVRKCSKRPLSSSNTCIGYLKRTETCSHRVYYKDRNERCETNTVTTLAQIFSSISTAEQGKIHSKRMLQYESLRLARQLASAVLQFHATPILEESWRSEDVVFFGQSSISILQTQHLDMKMPHLNVKLRTRPGKTGATQKTSAMMNTNPYTFGLGVILLEIAYQVPFQDLCRLESNSSLSPDRSLPAFPPLSLPSLSCSSISTAPPIDYTLPASKLLDDFSFANSLAYSLGTELGVPYARMVRKCLNCDFGQGTRDLNNEGLQEAFYRDVVCELERLEEAFAGLQLGVVVART